MTLRRLTQPSPLERDDLAKSTTVAAVNSVARKIVHDQAVDAALFSEPPTPMTTSEKDAGIFSRIESEVRQGKCGCTLAAMNVLKKGAHASGTSAATPDSGGRAAHAGRPAGGARHAGGHQRPHRTAAHQDGRAG